MKTAKIYSAEVNGTFTQIKAYNKKHALEGFKKLDENIKLSDIYHLKNAVNSHQAVWDEIQWDEAMNDVWY